MQFRRVDENVGGSHLVVRKRQVHNQNSSIYAIIFCNNIINVLQLNIRAGECSRALDFLMSVNEGKSTKNLLDRENKYKVLHQLQVIKLFFGLLFSVCIQKFVLNNRGD